MDDQARFILAVGRGTGVQPYGEPHTWSLPAFAKWEIRVRSGRDDKDSKSLPFGQVTMTERPPVDVNNGTPEKKRSHLRESP